MNTYTFSFFVLDDDGKCVCRDFPVRSSRFAQAFYCFARFFNEIVSALDYRDFSVTYKVSNGKTVHHRVIPSKYLSSLHRLVPEV